MPAGKKKAKDLPNFEDSLDELEEMVDTMDSGQLALEELISTYERGAKLIAHCESMLDGARKRLELIKLEPATTKNSGNTKHQPDGEDNTPDQNPSNDDEIRLF